MLMHDGVSTAMNLMIEHNSSLTTHSY